MINFEQLDLNNADSAAALKTLIKDKQFRAHIEQESKFMGDAMTAIARNGTVSAGAEALLLEKAMQQRKTLGCKTVMLKADGTELVNDRGLAGVGDWIEGVARASYPYLFNRSDENRQSTPERKVPSHDGTARTMTRSDFGQLTPAEQMAAVKQGLKIVDT